MSASGKKDKQGKQLPVLDKSKANDMNMMVLKRIDSQIEEVIASAAHVCLYRMSVNEQQWQRKNIEGSLFLIKRRTQPRFQMLVLNKLSTDNYIETVHGGLEMETNPPYLMYTHGNDEIHGIWFYDESDLHHLAGLLQKILNQLPKPDDPTLLGAGVAAAPAAAPMPQQQHYQPAPVPAVQEPSQPGGHAAVPDGDAFWDRSVHVTEETLPASQQLVPNSSLLTEPSGGVASSGAGSLQGLLMAAQQKHHDAQRAGSLPAQQPAPAQAQAPLPVPNSTSAAAEPAAPPPAATLLTPAFFEQQKQQKEKQQAAAAPAPAPAVAVASSSSSSAAAPQPPAAAALPAVQPNGASAGGNALHQLLSRAAKHTPSGPVPPAAAAGGATRGHPQPPIGVLSQEAIREKLKAALIRLANNDAFVDVLAQELKTVGLLQ